MYYIITSRGLCKSVGTNYEQAMENYRRIFAYWKKLYYREPSRTDLIRTDYGDPDPTYNTGKNGLRFCMIAG